MRASYRTVAHDTLWELASRLGPAARHERPTLQLPNGPAVQSSHYSDALGVTLGRVEEGDRLFVGSQPHWPDKFQGAVLLDRENRRVPSERSSSQATPDNFIAYGATEANSRRLLDLVEHHGEEGADGHKFFPPLGHLLLPLGRDMRGRIGVMRTDTDAILALPSAPGQAIFHVPGSPDVFRVKGVPLVDGVVETSEMEKALQVSKTRAKSGAQVTGTHTPAPVMLFSDARQEVEKRVPSK